MSLSPADCEQAADDLYQAEVTGQQISLLSLRHPGMDMDDAYAIQSALVERKHVAGRNIIGWKIGLTSKAMQAALNIDIPDSGVLFDDMLFANGSTVRPNRFIQPRVEIAFVMKSPFVGEQVTRDDVIAATDYVALSLEILDTRILRSDPETGTARKIFGTIADNACIVSVTSAVTSTPVISAGSVCSSGETARSRKPALALACWTTW